LITISDIRCGAETLEDVEEFGLAKETLLKKLLLYKNSVLSDDTLRRFFKAIDYTLVCDGNNGDSFL
jgi:hypothetical protein